MKKTVLALLLIVLMLTGGCVPQRHTVYMQDQASDSDYEERYGKPETVTNRYRLQPNDALFIRIRTANPQLGEYFNPGTGTSSQASTSPLFTYPIDDDYNIDFPFVGKINLKGCTRRDAKDRVKEALEPYARDAQVTLRLSNPTFTAIGETGSRGKIDMGKEQVTIYEAVAMAGDVRTFGVRREVKIVRPTPEGSYSYYVDLTDDQIIDSDHYWIYPNDLIYVRPMRAKQWGIGESFSFGILTSAIAVYLTIKSLF
ncbi:polysaccharide biosynthesis/export family protein [Marinilabiliaceae bacterium ANBcel2]|nr:polysaccharide biosynthesis/export family protein [Marinilabiliaceae bacterium ANBcel2]